VRWSTDGGGHWTAALTDSGTDQVTTRSTTVHGLVDGSPYHGTYPDYDPVLHYRLEVRAHNVAGWGPWASARLASGVLRQAPPFVPGDSTGDAAAAAMRDMLTGSSWSDGYPTPAGAGEWHEAPLDITIPASCGPTTRFACPGGVPQDPAPRLVVDLTAHVGDSARRTVSNVPGAYRYDLTYRGRVHTSEPVAVSYAGAECTVAVDSTAGSSPDLEVTLQVQFTGAGWETRASAADLSVTGLESADYVVGGDLVCTVGGALVPGSLIESQLAGAVEDFLNHEVLTRTCGAIAPYYWQPCYPILDEPLAVAASR
jgi:hypothetical protein